MENITKNGNKSKMIRAFKGGEVYDFSSIKECAAGLSLSKRKLGIAISEGLSYNGWSFESSKHSSGTCEGEIFDSRMGVIGISPKGDCVRFKNIGDVSERFNISRPCIYFAIRHGTPSGKWRWIYDDGRQCVALTDELYSTFVNRRAKKNGDTQTSSPKLSGGKGDNPATDYGYFDEEYFPVVCPVCDLVLGTSGSAHIRRCLANIPSKRTLNGVIMVNHTEE